MRSNTEGPDLRSVVETEIRNLLADLGVDLGDVDPSGCPGPSWDEVSDRWEEVVVSLADHTYRGTIDTLDTDMAIIEGRRYARENTAIGVALVSLAFADAYPEEANAVLSSLDPERARQAVSTAAAVRQHLIGGRDSLAG